MKFLITVNFLLSLTLGYFVYENFKKSQSSDHQIALVNKSIKRTEMQFDNNAKLLMELKIRLQQLDKNVNGHEAEDSLRFQIGALQSDLEALEKKLK